MSCRECHLSRDSQLWNIFSIFIVLTCISMRAINVFKEAARFESESESLQTADSRGAANIHWNHSQECQVARISGRPDCSCSRGVFTAQHLEHFEQNLRQTEVEPDERAVTTLKGAEVAMVRVKEKKSLVFFSKYFGITHGFKDQQSKLDGRRRRNGSPCRRRLIGSPHPRRRLGLPRCLGSTPSGGVSARRPAAAPRLSEPAAAP